MIKREKTQQNVTETIEFYLKSQGSFLYAQIEPIQEIIKSYFEKSFPNNTIEFVAPAFNSILTDLVLDTNNPLQHKFDVLRSGYYLINVQMSFFNGGTPLDFYILKNNTAEYIFRTSATDYNVSTQTIMFVNAGDFISFKSFRSIPTAFTCINAFNTALFESNVLFTLV